MNEKTKLHPNKALFGEEKDLPIIPACEHFAGSEKLIRKALALQEEFGPVFDITCDCEDGAPAGSEVEHAEMIGSVLSGNLNKHKMAGVRIHDYSHPDWKQDIDILVPRIGNIVSYFTLPKARSVAQVAEMISYIKEVAEKSGIDREIPTHVLIETHGALKDVWEIAKLPSIQVLDFGIMDFISDHQGAISFSNARTPGQFEHELVKRAKTEVVAAALANGIVPAHNVCSDLKNTDKIFQDAERARKAFSFLRMWSIYPMQISPIVEAMKPDYSEIEDAGFILTAAQDNEWGPIQFKGELHDRATYRYYWQLLKQAHSTGHVFEQDIQDRFF